MNKQITLNLQGLGTNMNTLQKKFVDQAQKEKWTKEEIKEVINEAQSQDTDHLLLTIAKHCKR